ELGDYPIGERQIASLASANDEAKPAAARSASSRVETRVGPTTSSGGTQTPGMIAKPDTAPGTTSTLARPTRSASADSNAAADATPTETSADRLPIPPGPVSITSDTGRSAGIVTTARPNAADTLLPGHDSSLFSDQTPF